MQCRQCRAENDAGLRFCESCGAALAPSCPSCGHELKPEAKFCGKCGASLSAAQTPSAAPQPPAATIGSAVTADGERRQVTALFCDLVGSTEIASRLDPEEWHRISKDYQQAAAAAVTRFGGHVDKFLGDGLVCFFGVPQAHEDDAERAVRAGLAIVDAVQGLNGEAAAPPVRLQVRVGVHTGSAVVAHGGGESKDVFGNTPNIAARLQGAAKPDTVVISAATQRLVSGLFVVQDLGAQALKGVPQSVVLYHVVQPSGVRSRFEVSAGRHTPFVGRQTELGTLRDAWDLVVEGMGQTVLVQGEAGLGKSRLCYQLREQLSGEPHTWLECRCSPYTAGTAFRPVTELVEQALTFQPADTPAEKLGKLSVGLARGGFAADEAVALLAEWLDLPASAGYTPLQTNSDFKRHKTLETLAAWNLKLGELQPMVVMVEDLHWCDPSSLELLGRLVAQSATARVLLIGTARPEFANPWPGRSNLQTLTLTRLTKRQTREMVAAVSAARTLPEALVEQLVARADGIPLFAEELTQAVVEARDDAAVAAIPVTLQDSLLARLDRLSSAKEVAQRAAVLGREFSYALVAATAGMDEAALQQGLVRLAEAELLFVRGVPPASTYTFKHALVQEAAYESLLKRTRQQLHDRVVNVLLKGFPERAAAQPEVVARHAELAGRIDEAIAAYERAGEQAKARSAHEEAIGHFRKALTILEGQSEKMGGQARELQLQLALAPSLAAARGYAHAETELAYQRAGELSSVRNRSQHLSALVGLANVHLNAGRFTPALELIDQALATADTTPKDWHIIAAYREKVMIAFFQGQLRMALEYGERIVTLYDPSRHHRPIVSLIGDDANVVARSFLAWTLWLIGYPEQATRYARTAMETGEGLNHPFSTALATFFASTVHWMCRETSAQREVAQALMHHAEAQGFPFWHGLAAALHGNANCDPDAVTAGMTVVAATGNRAAVPLLDALVAQTFLGNSQLAEARRTVESALTIAAKTGQQFFDAELRRLQGECLLAQSRQIANGFPPLEGKGSEGEPEACFHMALEIARAQEAKSLELRAATSLARLWRDQGNRAMARDLLAPVYAWFTEGFDTGDLIDAKALLEELSQ